MKSRVDSFKLILWSLFVGITLLGLVIGWVCINLNRVRQQKRAILAVEELGGSIFYANEIDQEGHFNDDNRPESLWSLFDSSSNSLTVTGIDFYDDPICNDDLLRLKSFKQLAVLQIVNAEIDDAGIQELKTIVSLKKLTLARTHVSRVGVEELKKELPRLKVEFYP